MRGSSLLALVAAVILVLGLTSSRSALADAKAKKEIETKMKEAMENYDLLEYEEARKILNQALTVAKKAKMESDPVTAKVHLRLGIVYFAGLQDAESAKLSFLNAMEIDKSIQLDKAQFAERLMRCPAAPYFEDIVAREVIRICDESRLNYKIDPFGNFIISVATRTDEHVDVMRRGLDEDRHWVPRRAHEIRHGRRSQWIRQRLPVPGKLSKVALTACMRKLLTMLNAMARSGRSWDPEFNTD